jgi:hypothetical protein
MIEPSDNRRSDDDGGRRSRIERELTEIRQKFAHRGNVSRGFAHVRDNYPEAATILFCGRDLRFTDLKNADLRDIDFRGADLSGCDFTNARIVGARFELAKVSRDALRKAQDWQAFLENWEPPDPIAPVRFRRDPGERFGVAPFLPELVILPHDLLARDGSGGAVLRKEVQLSLATGRLAVAIRCVTAAEWSRVVDAGKAGTHRDQPIPLRSFAANTYCSALTRKAQQFGLPRGTRVALADFGLFHLLAVAGRDGGAWLEPTNRTDLTPADVGVRGDEFEFVERWSDEKPPYVTAAGFATYGDRQARRVTLLQPPPERALLRPIFFLGEE